MPQLSDGDNLNTKVRVTNIVDGFFRFASSRSRSNVDADHDSGNHNNNNYSGSSSRSVAMKKVQFQETSNSTPLPGSKSSDDESHIMDTSLSSKGSWNVILSPAPTAPTDKRANFANQKNATADMGQPIWFEAYLPAFVCRIRDCCGLFVLNDTFQLIVILIIAVNALIMGIGTFDFVTNNPQTMLIFEKIDTTFLCIFTAELALHIGYWGYQIFLDPWLLFDLFTVLSGWLLGGVQVFRSFRIFRAFRLIVRIPILKSLVYAVWKVLPRISSIMGLFALLSYIYAVMATVLYKDYYTLNYTDKNYFGRLDVSLFTLLQFVTLDGWAEIARQVADHDPFAYIIFGSFLTVSGFILYSLVVAVICDSFLEIEAQVRAEIKLKAQQDRRMRRSLRNRSKRNLMANDDETEPKNPNASNKSRRFRDSILGVSSILNRNETERKRGVPPPLAARAVAMVDANSESYGDAPTSPATTMTAKTIAFGALERKKRRKQKPVKQRIQRVRNRLNKLTLAQGEILSALDDMCKEMERRNGIEED